jgi:hypothetical protein
MKKFSLLSVMFLVCMSIYSQVPQGFNYQAIARNSQGNPITNSILKVRLSVLTDTTGFYLTGAGTYLWEEEHTGVPTNSFGLFNLILGATNATKVQGSAANFSSIDWSITPLFIGVKVANPTDYKNMGAARLLSVPYSLVSTKASNATTVTNGVYTTGSYSNPSWVTSLAGSKVSGTVSNASNSDHSLMADSAKAITKASKLSVVSGDDTGTSALFEVKRKDGQTVFAVYPDAVNIYVPRVAKGQKGGFAIGGFDGAKATPQDYFRVTPDSVRVYIKNNPPSSKGSTKGGFAIGGYDEVKGYNPNFYMNVTGASAVNTVDSASQILWYPNKQAFLAGRISITTADSVGTNSTALGYKSRAIGNYSQAFGYKTTARGDYSTAIGQQAVAGARSLGVSTASNAFAFGNNAYARGSDSYAFGSGAIASGYRSFAIGSVGLDDSGNPTSTPTTANKDYTTAIGMGAQATQRGAMALGIGATSSGYYSNSFGYYSNSTGYYTTALGFRSTASGNYAGALGFYANAGGLGSIALGYSSNSSNSYSGAFGYYAKADGVGSMALGNKAWAVSDNSTAVGDSAKTQAISASAFGRMAKAKGASSVAIGYNAQTLGTDASALGKNATASGLTSMALGVGATATGSNSIAIGNTAIANATSSTSFGSNTTTSATALYSTALGYGSSTQGQYATALGFNSQAIGDKSLAIGAQYTYTISYPVINRLTGLITWITRNINTYNTATRAYSLAIGNGNTAQDGGLAIGSNNSALALGAVALGHSNEADTSYSFAAGYNSLSTGLNAIAIGEYATAQSANSFVIGTYNNISGNKYSWVNSDPLFVIGNGDSGTPHDAVRVLKSGATYIYPDSTTYGIYEYSTNTNYGLYTNNYASNYLTSIYGIRSNTNQNNSTATGSVYGGYFTSYNAGSGSVYGLISYVNNTNSTSASNSYSGYFYGTAVNGHYLGEFADVRAGASIDLAEYIYDTYGNTQPADVVVADPDKKESVLKSSKPYQSSVVGVVSTKPHMTMGMDLVTDIKTGQPLDGVKAARLALSGRVPVNVCGENGSIVPGDYLTTSSTPGVAMKWSLMDVNTATDFADLKRIMAENEKRRNAIIGKAVESFNGTGTGKIMVLISLQ